MQTWTEMWLIAGALFAAFKTLTWVSRSRSCPAISTGRTLGYFFAWIGLDANEFCAAKVVGVQPGASEWVAGIAKTLLGGCVLWGLVRILPPEHSVVVGAFGFGGLILGLHFGLFHLLSLAWRWHGVDVGPIMRRPFLARSLAEFWGERWNRAYRQISFTCFFRPAAHRFGATTGTLVAFFMSGLIHELVISVPARAGFGGPTAYFVVQGLGLLFERMAVCRRLILRHPFCGWCYTLVILLGPIGWLFHRPFLTRVIVPFLGAIGAR